MLATVLSKRFSAPFFFFFFFLFLVLFFFFNEQPAEPNGGTVAAKVTDPRQVEDETMTVTRGQQR